MQIDHNQLKQDIWGTFTSINGHEPSSGTQKHTPQEERCISAGAIQFLEMPPEIDSLFNKQCLPPDGFDLIFYFISRVTNQPRVRNLNLATRENNRRHNSK